MIRTVRISVFALFWAVVLVGDGASAQSYRFPGTEFRAMRPVRLADDQSYSVVVVEFLHHGLINAEGTNLLVTTGRREMVPSRVLQLGPGDFCRLAIQVSPGNDVYNIFYGGDPPTVERPAWTATDGLLMETRRYERPVADTLDAVRDAFERAKPIGASYVESVRHAHNPFTLEPGPMLSRYSGQLGIKKKGDYGFYTAARDVGFLLIDGKQVTMAAEPKSRATLPDRNVIRLSAGRHTFEVYHAAATARTSMLVAWQFDPPSEKPSPVPIPPDAFRMQGIGRVPVGPATLVSGRTLPDFVVDIQGDVPLPDHPQPLISVSFRDVSPQAMKLRAAVQWDFGDGQTSDLPVATHVYLRPGIYPVTLSLTRAGRTTSISNRVNVGRPILMPRDRAKLHKLDDYLPIIDTYETSRLDAASLVQLALAYQAKAQALQVQREHSVDSDDPPADPKQFLAKAIDVGKVAFSSDATARDARELHALACLVGPMARERLGDSRLAAQLWYEAAKRIDVAEPKVECELQAADVAINDLLNLPAAKDLLDAAAGRLSQDATGPVASKLHRVWGDYYAATGDGNAARNAYDASERVLGSRRTSIQRAAWRGAHGRSTEAFLRERQFDRAAEQLSTWQNEFPAAKIDGYLTLLYARYWVGRAMHRQAIAQAEQLRCVNPDSPHADRILLLAADCEIALGRPDRAQAKLESLLHDYPGSPLVAEVKKKIAEIQKSTP